uniref:Uncharacterized protein n=1 Tax=Streptomyces sp. Y27 TaxID=701045 RepID=F4Y9K2_9ACTN|nr:hypothetical protein [Streptomyces sp. Y27]AEB91041.1 hypothetical protein pWTY27_13 [Streptomyces sp. Y27]
MTIDPVPTGPVETAPRGFVDDPQQLKELHDVLDRAGIQLGAHDRRITEWVSGWEWSTVATITSWVQRASTTPTPPADYAAEAQTTDTIRDVLESYLDQVDPEDVDTDALAEQIAHRLAARTAAEGAPS